MPHRPFLRDFDFRTIRHQHDLVRDGNRFEGVDCHGEGPFFGPASKITFGVLTGFFPIALNTLNGISAVDARYLVMARAMGASRLQLYSRVLFPFAIPAIVSGLRIGTGLVVIGVVVAEMLASRNGIGFLITYHRTLFDTGDVYLGFMFALALAIGVNRGLSALERRFGQYRALENGA